MKKELLGIRMSLYLPMLVVSLLAILFGSFFDFSLSQAIVDEANGFGRFMESIGISFAYVCVIFGGVMVFKGLHPDKRIWVKLIGYLILVASIGLCIYYVGKFLIKPSTVDKQYGILIENKVIGYLLSALFCLLVAALAFLLVKSDNHQYLVRAGLVLMLTMLFQFLFINLVKSLNCRPRYRFLTSAYNTDNEVFRSWWEFRPYSYRDDFHKSWPSGHTATAGVALLLPLLYPVLRYPFKGLKTLLITIGYVFTILIAFSRIVVGAHFLSDVGFGALIITLFCYLDLFLGDRLFKKKEEKKTE